MESSKIAEYLLKIKAVQLRLDPPFTWSSGWKSPIYCDNRLSLSYPEVRNFVRDSFVHQVRERYPEATAIAGVATGAIALGALVANAMDLPMVYIRSKAKGHGMAKLVEGKLDPEGKYVVIEDLVSTGKSSVKAVKALQDEGATVLGTLAIFSYGFPVAEAAFSETGTPFHSLTNLSELLQKATEINYLQPESQATIMDWQKDPELWQNTLS
ncbi:MAG: orotate phosphoribosyltransferase [Bacteroidota bacterium]